MRRQRTFRVAFPDPRHADDYGLIAVGGDYDPPTLLAAYSCGIFPWPCSDLPFAWFSPNPRTALRPEDFHLSRSLRKTLRCGRFEVRFDTAFEEVIHSCAASSRPDGDGTWLTPALIRGLIGLHHLGFAHSVESWLDGRLVGGLYGISLGTMFCGESMFYLEPDGSKVAFATLVARLLEWDFRLIDCQVHTDHLERLGATEWPRGDFLDEIAVAVREPTRRGRWTVELAAPAAPR